MRLLGFLLLCFFSTALAAQSDSSLLLKPDRFTENDILLHTEAQRKRVSLSATRTLTSLDELPYSVWVVTADDILRNGYVTLGDVLRAAPGIRVSAIGNALEGETFMMRGLPGNRYVKILLNDVPIKPAVAPGMPLGAQLPIRQAERIEVFYGPAAALYGEGACAGVINIILKETERPIFTQADLAFGNFGYNSLDLMLGGKLFKDKRIFRFSLYGSSTVRGRTDVFYDDPLFTTKNYLPLGLHPDLYLNRRNYRPEEFNDSLARTSQLAHDSRLIGLNLTFRGLHFTYNRMQRFDHSALGLSPLAVSYANPSNRISEQIETFALSFKKLRDNPARSTELNWYNTLSVLRYRANNTSSFTPVFDRLATALYYSRLPLSSPQERDPLLDSIFMRFSSNERYLTANGFDVRLESRLNIAFKPGLLFDAGLQANLGGGVPPMGYFGGPTQADVFGDIDPPRPEPFDVAADGDVDLNVFSQIHWQGKKLAVIGGVAANLDITRSIDLAPRLALLYRFDSTWSIYANYAEGFRRTSIHERVNTYEISPGQLEVSPFVGYFPRSERVRSGELGLRRKGDVFLSQLAFFYQEADYLTRNGYFEKATPFEKPRYGYAQAPGRALSIWGIQGTIGDDVLSFDLRQKGETPEKSEIRAHLEYYFQYSRGKEWFGYGLPATTDVRNYPRWVEQLRISLHARKWEFFTSTNRQNVILGSAVVYRDFFDRETTISKYEPYRTWDFMLRVYLSKHFVLYLHLQNAFNKHYAGIDATGTPDDLLYNPQPGRLLKFGVNYTMN